MIITGIIAEYNPFHNGHAYQLAKARELTGAEYLIVVMSGDFCPAWNARDSGKASENAFLLWKTAPIWFWNCPSVPPPPALWTLQQEPYVCCMHCMPSHTFASAANPGSGRTGRGRRNS